MKQFLTSLLAVCYLFTGSGIMLHQHYCMGEFVEGRLGYVHEGDTHACSKCGMKQKASKGCCETKTQVLKKAQDEQVQQMQDWLQLVQAPAELPSVQAYALQAPVPALSSISLPAFQLPPPDPLPLFLEYRNLRI